MAMNPIHLVRDTAAVFIDKDGTLVEDVPYNVDPALIESMQYRHPRHRLPV